MLTSRLPPSNSLPQAHLIAPLLSSLFTSSHHKSSTQEDVQNLVLPNVSVYREKILCDNPAWCTYCFLFFIKPDFLDYYTQRLDLNTLKEIQNYQFSVKNKEVKILEHYPSRPIPTKKVDSDVAKLEKYLEEDIIKKEKLAIEHLIPESVPSPPAPLSPTSALVPIQSKNRSKI